MHILVSQFPRQLNFKVILLDNQPASLPLITVNDSYVSYISEGHIFAKNLEY